MGKTFRGDAITCHIATVPIPVADGSVMTRHRDNKGKKYGECLSCLS